jgi:hypothetical protein
MSDVELLNINDTSAEHTDFTLIDQQDISLFPSLALIKKPTVGTILLFLLGFDT